MAKSREDLYDRLVGIVGPSGVKMDKLERILYGHDLAALPKEAEFGFKMIPDAVVKPKSALQVSEILKLACEERIPVVPRGGGTSGLGGSVPCKGGIVLDMMGMNKVLRVDGENMEVEVEAGATWQKTLDAAAKQDLLIGSYPSSGMNATIAGWVNTGGIGVGSYKYGSVVNNIRNMEVVLPQGQIINTGFDGVSDHSAGYNLNGLFVGSEGTLGVVTKVTMKAHPGPKVLKPISVQFTKFSEAYPLIKAITREHINPLHISFVDEKHIAYLKRMGKHVPGDGALLNIAFEGSEESVKYEESVLDKLIAEHGGTRLPDDVSKHEWDERYYEFRVRGVGLSAALGEIVFPVNRFPKVLKKTYELIENMKMEASITGMIGDRNTIMFMPYFLYDEKKIVKSLISLSFVKKLGDIGFKNEGRPLGFGLFFAQNLPKVRGTGVDVMYDMKTMLDPYDILNPGKLLEGVTRFGVPLPPFAMNLGMDVMSIGKRILPKDKNFQKKLDAAGEGHEHHKDGPPLERPLKLTTDEKEEAPKEDRTAKLGAMAEGLSMADASPPPKIEGAVETAIDIDSPSVEPTPMPAPVVDIGGSEASTNVGGQDVRQQAVPEPAAEPEPVAETPVAAPEPSVSTDEVSIDDLDPYKHIGDADTEATACPVCGADIDYGIPECPNCKGAIKWE